MTTLSVGGLLHVGKRCAILAMKLCQALLIIVALFVLLAFLVALLGVPPDGREQAVFNIMAAVGFYYAVFKSLEEKS